MPSPNPSFSVPLPTTVKVRVEEQMIQKDFRGYLTRAITWTALMPLFMLAFMHLNQIQRENEENDVRQIAVMEQLGRQLSNEIETIRSFWIQVWIHYQFIYRILKVILKSGLRLELRVRHRLILFSSSQLKRILATRLLVSRSRKVSAPKMKDYFIYFVKSSDTPRATLNFINIREVLTRSIALVLP